MLVNNQQKANEILKKYNRKLGLIPVKVSKFKPLSALKLPETVPAKIDLRDKMSPVKDQGQKGTCVAFAGVAVKEYQEKIEKYKDFDFSEEYLYYRCKQIDGYPKQEGTTLDALGWTLQTRGVCEESFYPYDPIRYPEIPPPKEADQNALNNIIQSFYSLDSVSDIKKAIYMNNSPQVIGILVCENFMEPKNGFIPLPSGYLLGGHALCVVGYDDSLTTPWGNKGCFIVKNSWGTSWGDKGYCYISYDYINWHDIDYYIYAFLGGIACIDYVKLQKVIELWIDKKIAKVDGKEVELDQAPIIVKETGRTLVPIRFVAENLDCKVEWNDKERKVTIIKQF